MSAIQQRLVILVVWEGIAPLLFSPCAIAEDPVGLARAANLSSIQAIRTFHCRVEVSQGGAGRNSVLWGEYWRSENAVGCRYRQKGVDYQLLIQGGRRISLQTRGERRPGLAEIHEDANDVCGNCDVWMLGLLVFTGPDSGSVLTFDELLKKPHKIQKAHRVVEEGKDAIYVNVDHELSHLELWFDPRCNFLVRKHIVSTKKQPTEIRSEWEVAQFKEVAAGIFFPEKVEGRHFAGSKLLYLQTVEFKDIRVNEPISADVFQISFPTGTDVTDSILGKRYKADEHGHPIGPMAEVTRMPSLLPGEVSRSETREEPKSLTRLFLPISLSVLLLAGILWLYQKRKQKIA